MKRLLVAGTILISAIALFMTLDIPPPPDEASAKRWVIAEVVTIRGTADSTFAFSWGRVEKFKFIISNVGASGDDTTTVAMWTTTGDSIGLTYNCRTLGTTLVDTWELRVDSFTVSNVVDVVVQVVAGR